jgi:hypothetical protein
MSKYPQTRNNKRRNNQFVSTKRLKQELVQFHQTLDCLERRLDCLEQVLKDHGINPSDWF